MIIWIFSLFTFKLGKGMVGCLPMSFNLSVKASANSFTVVMVGTELGDFFEEELPGVLKSGLLGLSGLVGSQSGLTPASVTVEGGVSLDFFGSFFLMVSRVGKEEGAFVVFPFSFRVFSLLFWRGVSLASSFSGLLWRVGTDGVFGVWSLFCLGGLPSAGSEGFFKPLGCAVERSLESGPPQAGLSLCAVLLFKLHAGPWRVVPFNFAGECSLDSGPPAASKSKCSKLCAFLSAGPGWMSTP